MKRLIVATVLVAIVGAVALAQSSDPQVGTWKLNAGKSKGTMFTGGTVTVEPAGQGFKTSVDLVGQGGTPSKWSFTAQPDGKDNPITGETPFGNTLSMTRVDARTLKTTIKQDRSFTAKTSQSGVISGDNATITSFVAGYFQGPNAAGATTASGVFRTDIVFTDTNRKCTSNDQPWTAARTG